MKNNFTKNMVCALLTVIFMSVNYAYARPSIRGLSQTNTGKILITMAGIFVFMFVLYLTLSIYNKFFVPSYLKDSNLYKDSLYSPSDIDDAVKGFIYKNRLK